jgi:hypothetical protein
VKNRLERWAMIITIIFFLFFLAGIGFAVFIAFILSEASLI